MKKLITILLLATIFVLSPQAAFAWKKEFKKGLKYYNVQAYPQAIVQFEKALESRKRISDKKRAEIQGMLAEAKTMAAVELFQTAEKYSDESRLIKAIDEFEMALSYDPDNLIYRERLATERQRLAAIQAQYSVALDLARQQRDYRQALARLESLGVYRSSLPQLPQQVNHLKNEAAQYYLQRSDHSLTLQEYRQAYDQAATAFNYKADSEIEQKKRARHHLLMAQESWNDRAYENAYEHIQKGLQFEPDNPELDKFRDRLTGQWAGVLYNQAMQANVSGEYGKAKQRFSRIASLRPGYLDVAAQLQELDSVMSASYYEQAEAFLNDAGRERIGTALIYYLLVQEQHNAIYRDIDDKVQKAKRLLRDELEFRLALTLDNKSAEPGVDGLVKDKILARIRASRVLKNVSILEREVIDDILREQGLGQAFLDETTSLPVKKIRGIQAGIRGEVIKVSVKETGRDRPSYGSSRYVSGTRWVPNPRYDAAQHRVAQMRQQVIRAQQDLTKAQNDQNRAMANQPRTNDSAGRLGALASSMSLIGTSLAEGNLRRAEEDLATAQADLAHEPRQIEEKVWDDYRYEIFNLELQGEVILSFRFINYATSEIGQVHTVEKRDSITDVYIPGDPGKGVASDAIELPPQDVFKNQLLDAAIEDFFQRLEQELGQRAKTYHVLAKRAEERGITDDAIENYMRYMYSAPSLSDPSVQEANNYIYEQTGLLVLRRKK